MASKTSRPRTSWSSTPRPCRPFLSASSWPAAPAIAKPAPWPPACETPCKQGRRRGAAHRGRGQRRMDHRGLRRRRGARDAARHPRLLPPRRDLGREAGQAQSQRGQEACPRPANPMPPRHRPRRQARPACQPPLGQRGRSAEVRRQAGQRPSPRRRPAPQARGQEASRPRRLAAAPNQCRGARPSWSVPRSRPPRSRPARPPPRRAPRPSPAVAACRPPPRQAVAARKTSCGQAGPQGGSQARRQSCRQACRQEAGCQAGGEEVRPPRSKCSSCCWPWASVCPPGPTTPRPIWSSAFRPICPCCSRRSRRSPGPPARRHRR